MEKENITSESLTGGTHVESSDGGEAVGSGTTQEPSISLSKLKEVLGKDFKDPDTALKSIHDTFKYVGKAGQARTESEGVKSNSPSAANNDEFAKELKSIKEDLWYEKNPQFKNFKDVISTTGKSPEEVVSNPAFKDLFSKAQGFEESQKLKTVLETNPRLASSSDKQTKAIEALNKGEKSKAHDLATASVMEAYGME